MPLFNAWYVVASCLLSCHHTSTFKYIPTAHESGIKERCGSCGAGGEEYSKYKQQVVEMVKAGQLVVQMLAAEESITMPDGSRKATFLQDTWDMVRPPHRVC